MNKKLGAIKDIKNIVNQPQTKASPNKQGTQNPPKAVTDQKGVQIILTSKKEHSTSNK